jgi:cation transport protein ChaC
MWRPGFDALESSDALLHGYHRAFCLFSHHHRGTSERPGLVLGLDRGGSCRGVAFRVSGKDVASVISYLNDRELGHYAYIAKSIPITVRGERVPAHTYIADPRHALYAGDLGLERSASMIMEAQGESGLNRDYLINTVRKLETMGLFDQRMHSLRVEIERQTGIIEAGGGI